MRHGVIISDLHCGHQSGLCPPQYQGSHNPKIAEWQKKTWDWYAQKARGIGRIDRLVINGDACEGNGIRSGATELITADRLVQAEIAEECARAFDFAAATVIEGTNSHTGDAEQFEGPLARALGTRLQAHAWLEHAGCVIDLKHHIGSTSTPGALPPALTRESVWNLLWAERDLQPRANVVIRSHLHKHHSAGDENFTALVTPALQGWTKYGGTRMSKTISYGFIEFWVDDNGGFTWKTHILVPRFAAARAESL